MSKNKKNPQAAGTRQGSLPQNQAQGNHGVANNVMGNGPNHSLLSDYHGHNQGLESDQLPAIPSASQGNNPTSNQHLPAPSHNGHSIPIISNTPSAPSMHHQPLHHAHNPNHQNMYHNIHPFMPPNFNGPSPSHNVDFGEHFIPSNASHSNGNLHSGQEPFLQQGEPTFVNMPLNLNVAAPAAGATLNQPQEMMDQAVTFHQAQIYPFGGHLMGFNQQALSQEASSHHDSSDQALSQYALYQQALSQQTLNPQALNQDHPAVNHQQVELPVNDPPTLHPQANHPAVLALGTITVNTTDEDVRNIVREAADVLYAGHGQCKRLLTDGNGVERRCTARV
ncbi:hypothetical protein GE21DRAFT_5033 [Neurospora crassa]|uniref:Uncharacterized protein n=1 Tax=Neurospora crassa (strain ATCC 24698 / 74-OR23-1A / CBS 708.71 / DSM 1257 / FGSC 987) TaxID=367110 RepID=Q7S3J3_NEUCR|nr:hypothetical protein NCU08250 [Neurospora crassa OR74A]EAA30104.1 hypothetical protein NCU08250 [Neurospora crassa OR74A]KHE86507.1 hypothetical protein GE21DRAFT_5033 [Neurospora crassa]|eukprot:XP_959340.1 hypothetical protein NCU08250 [Neurospora crassa OR74A]